MSRSYTSSPPSVTMACSGTALLLFCADVTQLREIFNQSEGTWPVVYPITNLPVSWQPVTSRRESKLENLNISIYLPHAADNIRCWYNE
jgi:hypothetical protein